MQITQSTNDTVQLKTKTEPVVLGNDCVRIGQKVLSGPGEYEVAGILCEGQALPLATAYFVRDEDLLIAYLTHLDPQVSDLDDVSETGVLILDIKSDDEPSKAKAIIKALEPAYVFLIGAGATSEFRAGLGLTSGESGPLKVTGTSLPLENTVLIPA